MGLPVRIELANAVAVQRLHDTDPREHRRAARRRDQDQGFHRHSAVLCSAFGSLVMYLPASSRVTRRRPRGNGIGSLNWRFQPFAALRANVRFFLATKRWGRPAVPGLYW